jgi:hypothetical protein
MNILRINSVHLFGLVSLNQLSILHEMNTKDKVACALIAAKSQLCI